MDDQRTPKVLDWKQEGSEIRRRPRKRWFDDVQEDL